MTHKLRDSQEFFQSLFLAIQQKLALQSNSKGSSLPSSCFLDRLLPANMACQCDSLFHFIFSASPSPGTQVRPRKWPFTSWQSPYLLMGKKKFVIYTLGYISCFKQGMSFFLKIRNLATSIPSPTTLIDIYPFWWSSFYSVVLDFRCLLVLLMTGFEILLFNSLMVLRNFWKETLVKYFKTQNQRRAFNFSFRDEEIEAKRS